MDSVTIRDVDTDTWPDLDALFSARGGPGHCWCLVWRPKPRGVSKMSREQRRDILHAFVERKVPIGLLAYEDEEPVAWCSVGPRDEHRRLGGLDDFADHPEAVWSLTCFFIRRSHRGRGLTRHLIEAAAKRARKEGADVLEAYPVAPDAPSYRFMGFVPVFEEAGFAEVGRAGHRRHVMRRFLA